MTFVPTEHVRDYPRTHKLTSAHSLKNGSTREREREDGIL